MRKFLIALCLSVFSLGMLVGNAEAARVGGGKSVGMQRSATPAPQAPAAQRAAPAPTTPAAATPKRNWMGPLAGLAAGLGLAALASHFGFGEELANFLLIALLAMVAIFVVRMLMNRGKAKAPQLGYAGAGAGAAAHSVATPAPTPATSVGSLRSSLADTTGSQAAPAAGTPGELLGADFKAAPSIPADFDAEGFLRVAKLNFVRLQAANDRGDVADLREFLSPEVFAEVKMQLDERQGATQQTDVVTLEAQLLEVVTEGDRHIASVHFSGTIREQAGAVAEPFSEVWNLAKPVTGDRGWTVAGIQQVA